MKIFVPRTVGSMLLFDQQQCGMIYGVSHGETMMAGPYFGFSPMGGFQKTLTGPIILENKYSGRPAVEPSGIVTETLHILLCIKKLEVKHKRNRAEIRQSVT